MANKKIKANLLDEKQIQKTLVRLSHEIIEKNSNLKNLAIIGIRTRGDVIAHRIHKIIKDKINKKTDIPVKLFVLNAKRQEVGLLILKVLI